MFCPRCGKTVEEGIRYCPSCGQDVGAAVANVPGSSVAPPGGVSASAQAPMQYGGFWVRFVAYLVDGLILGIPYGIIVAVMIAMFGGIAAIQRPSSPPADPAAMMAMMAPIFSALILAGLFSLIVGWLYFALMESSARQATLGKSLMSLRVTNGEGRRLSFGHATGRYFAKIISGMIPLAIGYIMAGFTAKKQALHDFIAGTLVLKS
jgi:uncharacterized RDD family membrane protein YckC